MKVTDSTSTAGSAPFRISEDPEQTDFLAKYFRGLGDPTRLRILELLTAKERSVGELVEKLDESQPKISNHLACLRWCGFVESRRQHRTIWYRVADERIERILKLGRELLEENEDHIRACRRVDGKEQLAPPSPRRSSG